MNLFKARANTKICFVHVPKCGGESIKYGIERAFKKKRKTIRIKAAPSLNGSLISDGQDLLQYRAQLLHYFLSDPDVELVMGHFPCRHETLEAFRSEWKFVTVLRNPIDRFISQLLYNTHKKSAHCKQTQSFDEYLESTKAISSGELYARYFSHYPITGTIEDGVAEAIKNLGKFDSVGLLENLEGWSNSFKSDFGRRLDIGHKNLSPTKSKKDKSTISPEQLEKITMLCEPSMRVYNHFDKR